MHTYKQTHIHTLTYSQTHTHTITNTFTLIVNHACRLAQAQVCAPGMHAHMQTNTL
jgi:hypothetical protein